MSCGEGPTNKVSSISDGKGKAKLIIYSGTDEVKPDDSSIQDIEYYICGGGDSNQRDCFSGCQTAGRGGQQAYTSPGSYTWTANTCGTVSIVAVGGGSGGGWQWSSGGGGGGGLGWVKNYEVKKGTKYTVVVGRGGPCTNNAGNTHTSDGGNSYFKDLNTVAGYGAGKGGPNAVSSSPGYGGGFKGDGGGRGGTGGRGNWHSGGGGAAGYKGRGGDASNGRGGNTCHHNNRNCDAPAGSGGGGGGGYYSSTWGTPAGGGVGIIGFGGSGRGDWQRGATGGSGGSQGAHGEPYSNGKPRCSIPGGKYGGGAGGSGSAQRGGGGIGGSGAVRIIWGRNRNYPAGGGNV